MWRLSVHRYKLGQLLANMLSFGTILGVVAPFFVSAQSITWWMMLLVGLFAVFAGLVIVLVFISGPVTRAYRADDKRGINKYMVNWIDNGGRVAVWTRDMSWAGDPTVNPMLHRKAASKELIICLPERNHVSDSLEEDGAEVIAYGTWDSPSNSFTITNYNRDGARIAVGRREGDYHVIREFSQADAPTFQLADDLVTLVREQAHGKK